MSRFEVAGLTPPSIASVTFTRYSEICRDVRGWYQPTPDGAELTFCFDTAFVCRDGCTSFLEAGRSLTLHELAHAWIDEMLDEEAKTRFRHHVGLEAWNDDTVPWSERAVEYAADTITWGLMDQEMQMSRLSIPGPTQVHLATGFRMLTETDPLPRTDQP